ncbi:DUF6282 family protein [Chloroflexota bacterium]
MNTLLNEAYDLHVHSAPDILPRKMDDVEMAQRIIAVGMKGYAAKSHFFCTSERAQTVNKLYPDCHVIGSITLNNSVGGINPMAVEMAGRSGAKIVWFPTIDSENEQAYLINNKPERLPYWMQIQQQMKAEGIVSPTISILENGKLKKEVFEVLDIIARFNMILATSHVSHQEAFVLVKAAKERKAERIVITHADFPSTFYTVEEQKELIKSGAFIEHCYTTAATGKVSWETAIGQIQAIGPEYVVLATDLGQSAAVYPDEGLAIYGEKLLTKGFSEADVRTMAVKNPTSLLS